MLGPESGLVGNGSEIAMPLLDAFTQARGRSVSVVATTDGERVALTAF